MAKVVPGKYWPHYMAISISQMISVISKVLTANNSKITKTHKDNDQANKYSKQQDKNIKSWSCFCHKNIFMYENSLSPALSHKHT